ncbi:hypothetical protein PABG_12565 [Paracoccidioides brasiliensis Pb03]|nr:hypothetical protein PABG_12565 [Paracoccidioides brasiliensis Pb03]
MCFQKSLGLSRSSPKKPIHHLLLLPRRPRYENLAKIPRCLWNATGGEIIDELGNRLTPGCDEDNDNGNLLHPAFPSSLIQPRIKPHGFSHDAFSHAQHAAIPTLTESAPLPTSTYASATTSASASDSGTCLDSDPNPTVSHANPTANLLFPFFAIEFTSAATDGAPHTATDEASRAAAIALNGLLSRTPPPKPAAYSSSTVRSPDLSR